MKIRLRPWTLTLAVLAFCAGLISLLQWNRQRVDGTVAGLVARMPTQDSVQIYIDVLALRTTGLLDLLAGSRAAEEGDYRSFVEATGFDYREDLDAVVACHHGGNWYFLLKGRFEWDQMQTYALAIGGSCRNLLCSVASQRPGRYLSFYPILPNVLALAASEDPLGAYLLTSRSELGPSAEELEKPVWVKVASSRLGEGESLPAGTRALASAVKGTEHFTISLGAEGGRYEMALRAEFPGADEAERGKQHLEQMSGMLRSFLSRANLQPNPNDWSGVLAGGQFERRERALIGRWPIERRFLEALASGSF